MLQVVYEELVAVFIAGVTEALHGLRCEQALLVAEAAEFQLVGPDVLGEITGGNARWPSLEHQDANPAFAQFLGDPSAAGSGSDDQNFVRMAGSRHKSVSLAEYNPVDDRQGPPR